MPKSLTFRSKAINAAIEKVCGRSYVEIGVKSGNTFKYITCRHKTGIDPVITDTKLRLYLALNRSSKFFRETSDDFFAKHADKRLGEMGIDVAFVDGLHTYEQTVKDVQYILRYLNEDGIIFLHDCNPENELAAIPGASPEIVAEKSGGKFHAWNGDVWKTIVHLRSLCDDLKVFVLNCDHGIGVAYRAKNDQPLDYTQEDIDQLTYAELEKNREHLLNLQNPDGFWKFLEDYSVSAQK